MARRSTPVKTITRPSHPSPLHALAACARLLAVALPAAAQGPYSASSYNVVHSFVAGPGAPGIMPIVTYHWYAHAWARDNFGGQEQHLPFAQAATYDPWGVDWLGGGGIAFNSGLGIPTICSYASAMVPPPGLIGGACASVALPTGSMANGCVQFNIAPYGPG